MNLCRMTIPGFLRRAHRVMAGAFLIAIPPAAYASLPATGGDVADVVYFPLFPLFGLLLTGTYLLAEPWIQWANARRFSAGT